MNNANMEKMLKMASGKLGISPNELKELLSKGDMNGLMAKMDSGEAQKFKNAMSNPDIVAKMKNSPEMEEFMKDMSDK